VSHFVITMRDGDKATVEEHNMLRIGSSKEVADGQMRVFDVVGTAVTVVHAQGRVFAFDDTCTHAGCSLANGKLDGTTVTCGCHGSQFDITNGAVLRGPARRPVRSRQVEVHGDDLLTEA
jgi:nitrite reductase/ring-hydroxylating ferredoxin subunit